jgi:hypothetical protein
MIIIRFGLEREREDGESGWGGRRREEEGKET